MLDLGLTCAWCFEADYSLSADSHCQGIVRTSLRRRMQECGTEAQAEERRARLARHDDPHHHAVRPRSPYVHRFAR